MYQVSIHIMKYLKEESLQSFYRLNQGVLEYQLIYQLVPSEDEWSPVEEDLVGSEFVTFRGQTKTFSQAYSTIRTELSTVTTMESQLERVAEETRKLVEIWDNEQIEYYPPSLMSFDELWATLGQIELKPKPLTLQDFVWKKPGYLSCSVGGRELCLEPCLKGFCVALYTKDNLLISSKRCTNIVSNDFLSKRTQSIEKALEIANQIVKEYDV